MLDVHVLRMAYTPAEWVAQCLSSIDRAAALAGFTVNLHVLPGIEGHIGLARAAGYACGSSPYVTYVDDDDYVLPNAFSVLAPAMLAGERAIYGREYALQNGALRPRNCRHNLQVHRRDALIDHSLWRGCADIVQRRVPGVDIMERTYVYRMTPGSKGRALARRDLDEYARAYACRI